MRVVVGVDEVGRGCWAGPLVVGAVILDLPIDGLRDSKKLSHKQRTSFSVQILKSAHSALGWVSPAEIDRLGLTKAITLAMERAIKKITKPFDDIMIDGNYNFLALDQRTHTIIKGDDLVPAISAASILAKVARDNYMVKASQKYPGYGFESHVGYGTKDHIAALHQLGPSAIHRMSYKPLQAFV